MRGGQPDAIPPDTPQWHLLRFSYVQQAERWAERANLDGADAMTGQDFARADVSFWNWVLGKLSIAEQFARRQKESALGRCR